jgi:hypothetical protein
VHKKGVADICRESVSNAEKIRTFFGRKMTLADSGLPDGLFSNQKSQFGQILDGLRWENVDIFYVHLEYFTDIWDIL